MAVAIAIVVVVRPDRLADSATLIAVVDRSGAVQVVEVGVDSVATTASRAPAAAVEVTSLSYGEGTIIQLLADGSVRVLSLEDDGLAEHMIWQGGATHAQASVDYEGGVAFLLPDGTVRTTVVGQDGASGVLLWPQEGLEVVDFTAVGHLLVVHTVDDRLVVIDPDDVSRSQEILDATTPIRKLTSDGTRVLVLLEDEAVHEYDLAAGVWSVLFESSETTSFAGTQTFGGSWFALHDVTTAPDQLTNGTMTVALSDGSEEALSVHGRGSTLALLTAAGEVRAYDLASQREPVTVTASLPAELVGIGVIAIAGDG